MILLVQWVCRDSDPLESALLITAPQFVLLAPVSLKMSTSLITSNSLANVRSIASSNRRCGPHVALLLDFSA